MNRRGMKINKTEVLRVLTEIGPSRATRITHMETKDFKIKISTDPKFQEESPQTSGVAPQLLVNPQQVYLFQLPIKKDYIKIRRTFLECNLRLVSSKAQVTFTLTPPAILSHYSEDLNRLL
jgi:hypothetical protein